jgi:hypothetical protein
MMLGSLVDMVNFYQTHGFKLHMLAFLKLYIFSHTNYQYCQLLKLLGLCSVV